METLKILVVDDEQGMRMGVARAMRNYSVHLDDTDRDVDFTVEQADSGEAAIEHIDAAGPPDILLLDHKMPGMSGLDVLDRIAERKLDILTVMITAYASLETAVSATKRGAYDFLAKPFTPDELKNSVRKAAGHVILTRQARQLEQEKRQVRFQFISVVAHELKAPLAAIEGYLNIIKDRTAGDSVAAYEQMIERCLVRSHHMRKMVLDLLDLTKIESGQKKRDLGEQDLVDAIQGAIETVAPDAAERTITINLDADGPVTMIADRSELDIIFNNLLSNAVKYNRDGGKVDVTVRRENDTIVASVADTGIGMSKEEADKLFGDFVRIKNEKTRNILGSGLGLSIVKKLAQVYGGDATVSSTPDVGTTFTITLQAALQDSSIQISA